MQLTEQILLHKNSLFHEIQHYKLREVLAHPTEYRLEEYRTSKAQTHRLPASNNAAGTLRADLSQHAKPHRDSNPLQTSLEKTPDKKPIAA